VEERRAATLEGATTAAALDAESLVRLLRTFHEGRSHPDRRDWEPEESLLVRRWYAATSEGLVRVRADLFSTWRAAAEALKAGLEAGPGEGVWVREPGLGDRSGRVIE